MRENCTYGSMRGRAYPITRGVPLYSTSSQDQSPSLGRKAVLLLRRMKVLGIDGGNVPDFASGVRWRAAKKWLLMKQYARTSMPENFATRQSSSTKRVFSSSFRKNARLTAGGERPQALAAHLVQRRLGPPPIGQRCKINRCRDNF